ncbi:MAG: hypothetical protein GX451_10455 [Acholeplasmataceae bacterium]|nr:hypothetical protein [Acholeplasmataceae bacterium]
MINYNKMTDTQKQVKAFEALVVRVLSNHDLYHVLTRCETKTGILSKTAQFFFFNILLDLLIRDFFLESAKILENSRTFIKRGSKQNLTVKHFVQIDGWTSEQKSKLSEYDEKLNDFYRWIKDARDKIISHNDLRTYEDANANGLGAFPEGLDDEFVNTLEEFYNYLHEISFGEPWGRFYPNVEASGIYELISFLYQGLAFETIVNDQKTSSKIKMLLVEKELEIKKF